MPDRLRLDELLVARGLYASRARARDAILRGGRARVAVGKGAGYKQASPGGKDRVDTIDVRIVVARQDLSARGHIACYRVRVRAVIGGHDLVGQGGFEPRGRFENELGGKFVRQDTAGTNKGGIAIARKGGATKANNIREVIVVAALESSSLSGPPLPKTKAISLAREFPRS